MNPDSRRHQPCPAMTSMACPMPYDALIQQLASRGGGGEQGEGSGSVPTSTPRARNVTAGSQQTGERNVKAVHLVMMYMIF